MKPVSTEPRSAVLRRVSLWSGVLGMALYLAAFALEAMGGPNPVRRGTLVVIGILFLPMIASLAVIVAVLTGIWGFVLSSGMPSPVVVGPAVAPTRQAGLNMKPVAKEPRAARRVCLWSGLLGAALYLANLALEAMWPYESPPAAVSEILLTLGLLSVVVAVLTGIWSLAFSSDIPRPVMVGRASLWFAVLAIVPWVLAVGPLRPLAAAVPRPLLAGLPSISMLASLVAVVTGIASLMMSLIDRKLCWSGLVGFVLGGLVLISPLLAILLYVFAYFSGGTRNF